MSARPVRYPLALALTLLGCARCATNTEHELAMPTAGDPCRVSARCLDCGLTTPTTLHAAGAWLAGVGA